MLVKIEMTCQKDFHNLIICIFLKILYNYSEIQIKCAPHTNFIDFIKDSHLMWFLFDHKVTAARQVPVTIILFTTLN